MAKNLLLILQSICLGSNAWGFYNASNLLLNKKHLPLIYSLPWFLIGGIANVYGILASRRWRTWSEYNFERITQIKQDELLLYWYSVVLGYTMFVASIYGCYPVGNNVHVSTIIALISFIPISIWKFKPGEIITYSTEITALTMVTLHVWISFIQSNYMGFFGALLMLNNLGLLIVPQRYKIHGITPKELFVIGIGGCSILFTKEFQQIVTDPWSVLRR